MKVALIGSVSSSYAALDSLIRNGIEITCVLGLDESMADSVSDYTSLRERSETAGLAFHSFTAVRDQAVEIFLRAHRPDLLWVIGLSQLVPDSLVRLARDGGVGFHPTMLPKGRGRAPVAWTILLNEPAAVSLFFLTDEPDAGDIIIQRGVPVYPDDYAGDLITRTNQVLAGVIKELSPLIQLGTLPRVPQDHTKATQYKRRTPDDGLIDWRQPTDAIYRLVRATSRPYPGAFTHVNDEAIKIWRARPASAEELSDHHPKAAPAGSIVYAKGADNVLVRTGDGGLWLTEVAPRAGAHLPSLKAGIKLGKAVEEVRTHGNSPRRRTASR